ncbi:MAG TPA: hypothetical protein VJ875_13980 [Pyrinomonadaceae bacterium]|nr:hypothetical protein [Pyrinomonadaceae bacterium]
MVDELASTQNHSLLTPSRPKLILSAGILLTLFLSVGCSSSKPSISGLAYSFKKPSSVVTYSLPPYADVEGLMRSNLLVELEVHSKEIQGLNAYFYGKNGSILEIIVLNPITPDTSASPVLFHLDTAGYAEYLLIEQGESGSPIKLCVSLDSGENFVSDLPAFIDLRPGESSALTWTETKCTPDLTNGKPRTIDEWPPSGIPPVLRKQDAQAAIYFFYPFPRTRPVEISSAPFGGIKRSGDMLRDVAPLGISKETPLKTMVVNPAPDAR